MRRTMEEFESGLAVNRQLLCSPMTGLKRRSLMPITLMEDVLGASKSSKTVAVIDNVWSNDTKMHSFIPIQVRRGLYIFL